MVLVVICLIYNTEYMLIQTPHVTPSPSPLVAMRLFSASAGLFLQQLFKWCREYFNIIFESFGRLFMKYLGGK